MPTQTVFLKTTNLPKVILVTIALSVSYENKDMPMETQPSKPVITQAEIMDTLCTRESSQE